jgi:hypothetical protein
MLREVIRAFILLSATSLVAYSSAAAQGPDMLLVQVSADASRCTVRAKEMPCTDLISHLEKTLKVAKTTPIALATKPGEVGDPHSLLAESLKKAGYSRVAIAEIGFVTEPDSHAEESM